MVDKQKGRGTLLYYSGVDRVAGCVWKARRRVREAQARTVEEVGEELDDLGDA
jgi:hypothetical protein